MHFLLLSRAYYQLNRIYSTHSLSLSYTKPETQFTIELCSSVCQQQKKRNIVIDYYEIKRNKLNIKIFFFHNYCCYSLIYYYKNDYLLITIERCTIFYIDDAES